MNSNCSNLLDLRNLQEQVKKAFCYHKLFWTFTVWINCSSDLKCFSRSLEQFFSHSRSKQFSKQNTISERLQSQTVDDVDKHKIMCLDSHFQHGFLTFNIWIYFIWSTLLTFYLFSWSIYSLHFSISKNWRHSARYLGITELLILKLILFTIF